MKHSTKIAVLIIIFLLCFGVIACSGTEDPVQSAETTAPEPTPTPETVTEVLATPE